jgi:hypothetical protein
MTLSSEPRLWEQVKPCEMVLVLNYEDIWETHDGPTARIAVSTYVWKIMYVHV